LEARAFKVPGFSVELHHYGSGAQKLVYVASVKSDQSAIDLAHHDVSIRYGRPQGTLPGGRWNDTAAVSEVQIAKRSLHVYEDESGPTYEVYVGDDWEHDRSTWWTRPNARLNKEPRLCVRYSGRHHYRGMRASLLEPDGDYREYQPEGDEPRSFDTHAVMEQFRAYLHDVVLAAIEVYPPADVLPDVCADLDPVPFPSGLGPFFTYGEGRDAHRIAAGQKCVDDLPPADRYGMDGGGWRLASLDTRRSPDVPEVAFDGFLWCGTSPNVPGEHGRWSADQLIKVTPKDARGIYVADHAAYVKRRAELATAIKDERDAFTRAEIDDFVCARARTIVPILDYKGDYEEPIYLINRELDFDEVEACGRRAP
ncbi:MAG TPA: hypothetical protein VLE97_11775, partial [Gaiellaceae bacterium]|nr:hypothetical protein [Gaiellaceae bacterium]